MSQNPPHPAQSRHIDLRQHFLRDMTRDGVLRLEKVDGMATVADARTKSWPAPSYTKDREYLWSSRVPFSALWIRLADWRDLAVFPTLVPLSGG